MDERLIKMRDCLRSAADAIDELIEIDKRQDAGEDVSLEKIEAAAGRMMINLMQIQNLSE